MKPLLLLSFIFALHAFGMGSPRSVPKPEPKPAAPVVREGKGYCVEFAPELKYSTPAQRKLIAAGSAKVRETIASQCFKDFIVNRQMRETDGRSSEEVWHHIANLCDVVPVKMYYRSLRFTSAIAYRTPPQKTINLNMAKFTEKVSPCRWAATMAHETMHSLGEYGHSSDWTPTRDFTVPYSVGGSVEKNGSNAFARCCID